MIPKRYPGQLIGWELSWLLKPKVHAASEEGRWRALHHQLTERLFTLGVPGWVDATAGVVWVPDTFCETLKTLIDAGEFDLIGVSPPAPMLALSDTTPDLSFIYNFYPNAWRTLGLTEPRDADDATRLHAPEVIDAVYMAKRKLWEQVSGSGIALAHLDDAYARIRSGDPLPRRKK
jgi:hypothetical protein